MAKHTEKTTPARRRVKIFDVEEAHVSFLEDVIAHSFSGGRDREDPESFSTRAGRRRLRNEFDAIWHSR